MSSETSRERVLKTINHQQPEGLAIDFGSSTSTGISVFAYSKLQEYLNLDKGELPKLYELFLMMADPSDGMIDRMAGDIIQLKRYAPHFGVALEDWKEWELHDGVRCLVPGGFCPDETVKGYEIRDDNGNVIARMPKDGYYFDQTYFPCKGMEEIEEIDSIEMKGISNRELSYLQKESERLHRDTDKAVMFPIYGRIFEAGMQAFGFEDWLVQIMTNEEMVHHYLNKLTDLHIQDIDRVLSTCNEYIDIVRFCDDLGTQSSLIMSQEVYRNMIKPYHTKMFQHIKKNYPKQKIALHCCGAIEPLIPDLIESGVDILNPVQISADNMDPKSLKEKYGDQIVFWGGGVDMQFEAVNASIDDLKKHVEELIQTFMPGGGFIFAPTHNIQSDISPERILAIYETAKKFR
ncbi:MAG: hypothetical protein KH366_02190 [Clostridiaceae bacterium]|nr:hypothetical protein [Clostridiaceae bacterium]